MKILKIEQLNQRYIVSCGDKFCLCIGGKLVHSTEIDSNEIKVISHWALVQIGTCGLAYVVGNDDLEKELVRLCDLSS